MQEYQECLKLLVFCNAIKNLKQMKGKDLYKLLIKQFEDSVSVSQYKLYSVWVLRHIDRICLEFGYLEVGKPFKFTICGTTRVAILDGFIIQTGMINSFIGLETGFGNVWYYEAKEPTKAELNKFDGHCLVLK